MSEALKKHAQQAGAYTNLVLAESSHVLYDDEKRTLEKAAEILNRVARL